MLSPYAEAQTTLLETHEPAPNAAHVSEAISEPPSPDEPLDDCC